MQSHGTAFFQSSPDDVLDIKAITEYERDRQRAHKGHDVRTQRKKFAFSVHTDNTPAWKRAVDDKEKHTGVLNRNSRLARVWVDYRERLEDPEDTADEEASEELFGKENKPSAENSPTTISVRLEDLIIRPAAAGKKSRQHSPKLITRPSTPRSTTKPSFDSISLSRQFAQLDISSNLVDPLMDTFPLSLSIPTDSDTTTDDDDSSFEFSSPGAEEWTVAVAEDGCVKYTTTSSPVVATTTATTTFSFMPCAW